MMVMIGHSFFYKIETTFMSTTEVKKFTVKEKLPSGEIVKHEPRLMLSMVDEENPDMFMSLVIKEHTVLAELPYEGYTQADLWAKARENAMKIPSRVDAF